MILLFFFSWFLTLACYKVEQWVAGQLSTFAWSVCLVDASTAAYRCSSRNGGQWALSPPTGSSLSDGVVVVMGGGCCPSMDCGNFQPAATDDGLAVPASLVVSWRCATSLTYLHRGTSGADLWGDWRVGGNCPGLPARGEPRTLYEDAVTATFVLLAPYF